MEERKPVLRLVHHWPTRALCLGTLFVQSLSLNWYLMDYLSYSWAAIFAADAIVIALFLYAMIQSAKSFHFQKHHPGFSESDVDYIPVIFIAWLAYSIVMSIKIAVIFKEFSTELEEEGFFGANTMKTTLALSGIIFLAYLETLHDLRHGHRKEIVSSLTVTVIFDILDGVDNMDGLFEKELRENYTPGLENTVIATCCINYILPTIPLFTLAFIKFGLRKLPRKLELYHKLAIANCVNVPMLVTRLIMWHGLSHGISIFCLKNIIVIGVTTFEVLEHRFLQVNEEDEDDEEKKDHETGV